MEVLVGLVVLGIVVFIGGLMLTGLGGVFVLFGSASDSKKKKLLESRGGAFFDELFNGASTITYNSRPGAALDATPVIQAGMARGYELVNNDKGMLLFQRVTDPADGGSSGKIRVVRRSPAE